MTEQQREINHEYTDEVVCPYCGDVKSESYEFFGDHDEDSGLTCDVCGKEFTATRHVSVMYSTVKAP